MVLIPLNDFKIDFSINPRKSKSQKAVDTYKEALEEYQEKARNESIDKWFPKKWEQRIEITKDHIVTQGCHTVLALREIYGGDVKVPAFVVKIDGNAAKGKADAAWLACQSNKKGLGFEEGHKSNAINLMLDQMQPTRYTQEDGKRPYMTNRELATAIGCGKSTVHRVRDAWLIQNGYKEKKGKKPKPNLDETAKRAAALLDSERIIGSGRSSVYLYYYPQYRESAESKGEKVWECKIGMTMHSEADGRIREQATGLPERPKIGLYIQTDKQEKIEHIIHDILKVRGQHIEEAPGREWFLTSPSEVEEIYNFIGESSHERASSTLR